MYAGKIELLQHAVEQCNEWRMGGLLAMAFDPVFNVCETAMQRQVGEFIQGLLLGYGLPGQDQILRLFAITCFA